MIFSKRKITNYINIVYMRVKRHYKHEKIIKIFNEKNISNLDK